MLLAILADFPIHTLPGMGETPPAHHATWLPPIAAGLEYQTDLEIHWITLTKAVSRYQTVHHLGQTFHLLPRRKLSVEILTQFIRERKAIRQLLQTLQPDLVHAWGTEQGYALAAADWTGRSLLSIQGILTVCCQRTQMPWLTRIQAISERKALAKTQHLTVESPWGAQHLRTLAPNAEITLLEYGVDPACFPMKRDLSEKPVAVFLGTVSHLKGSDTLLKAFSDPRLAAIELHLYGDGDRRLIDRQDYPPNIQFKGHQSRQKALEALSHAWCLVHPTRADTSPNAVKEARVIGLPVITTPEGGQTQYVENGISGYIHPAGDTEQLIRAVLAVTATQETSLTIGANRQAHCRALLAPTKTTEKLIRLYRASA